MGLDKPFGAATVSDNPFGRASPILILGILIFVIPMIGPIFGWNVPLKGLVTGTGLFFIIVGVIHSAFKQ